ncbi:MAG: SCP2 sterol-binding domain-containing protein [Myxococcales bacterium]|nr:SCP2 sterol-binding domain-containing protein [Myxococcales bacterium]
MSERAAAEKITPEIFFDEVVPKILSATNEQRKQLKGTCEVTLFGEKRSAWTVDLGKGTVQQGTTDSPDAYLEMDRQDFTAMMMNRLDLHEAVSKGRVRFSGNPPILAHFAAILEPRSMEY